MMLVSTRISFVVMVMAAACAEPDPAPGSGDDPGSEDVTLQCSAALPCPAPSGPSKQTICGQLYDLETNAKLGGATGAPCTTTTTSGPCSLAIEVHDALAFASSSATSAPLPHAGVEIDTCGRYRVEDVDVTGIGPFIGLSIDDAAGPGIAGTTVPVAIATRKLAGTATDGLEAWIVRESTTTQWASSGGPALGDGVFVPMFRAHMLGTPDTDPFAPQSGVTFSAMSGSTEDYYFEADSMPRLNIDTAAVATGVNGTALIEGATINDGVGYSGSGGLSDPTNCRWERHPGMALPGIVFVQIFRPTNHVGKTCTL